MFIIKDLSVTYPSGITAPKDLNLTIKESSINMLNLKSGSGKSTLLRILSGTFDVWNSNNSAKISGSILFKGEDILSKKFNKKNLKKSVFYLPPSPEDVFYMPTLLDEYTSFGIDFNEAIYILKSFGFDSLLLLKNPLNLSGGQKRICAISIAIAKKPEVLLIDNAFTGLDAHLKKKCEQNLFNLCKHNHSTIVLA